jgi:PhoPQ-activated pathogenicity-related protein
MKNFLRLLTIFCVIGVINFFSGQVSAAGHCYSEMKEVLPCFLNHDDGVYKYEFLEEKNDNPSVTIRTYILYSQKWPPIDNYKDIPSTIWKHKLVFYIPKTISYTEALLCVSGGRNKNINDVEEFLSSKEQMDYAKIAVNNKALVVELQDTLNQYLFFAGAPYKEDQIIAYAYKRFMDDPEKNAYLAGHLPMTKAVVQAMNAIQEILNTEYNVNINKFILAGASKRGWAVWLAALSDDRVEAIVPINIDVLNTQKSLSHICRSYGGACPPALRDYEKYNITKTMDTSAFAKLMEVEDPHSYLADSIYRERLTIPKYIINSSGDDFFVPDASQLYFKDLPGHNNHIRYLPNAMHYFRGNPISDVTGSMQSINDALNSYFYFILHKTFLPKVTWVLNNNSIKVMSTIKPSVVKLWVANNGSNRDFRCIFSYDKLHLFWRKFVYYISGNVCDNCYKEEVIPYACQGGSSYCNLEIPLPPFKKGWQASFVELHYDIDHKDFVVTTEVNITPDTLPAAREEHQDL